MLITNIFSKGIMDKDTSLQWIENGKILHSVNLRFYNDGNNGIGVNIKGTKEIQNLIPENEKMKCVGAVEDSNNHKIYSLIAGTNLDLILEYDILTGKSITVLSGDKSKIGFDKKIVIHGINIIAGMLFWTQKGKAPRKINIERAKTYGHNNFNEEDISVIKAPPLKEPKILLKKTYEVQENDIEERFISFAYRYKYLDGEVSAISFYSDIAFSPKPFTLSYDELDNEGMKNIYNYCQILFNTGDHRVTDIDLIFREAQSNTAYLIQSFNKKKEGWGDFQEQSYDFYNNKLFAALPESEVNLLYDNVPVESISQDIVDNRLIYANYVEGYDMTDQKGEIIQPNFSVEIKSETLSGSDIKAQKDSNYAHFDFSGVNFEEGATLTFNLEFKPKEDVPNGPDTYQNVFLFAIDRNYSNFEQVYDSDEFKTFISSVNYTFLSSLGSSDTKKTSFKKEIEFIKTGNNLKITPPVVEIKETLVENETENIKINIIDYSPGDIKIFLQENIFSRSIKSNRSYEAVISYYDKYNRLISVVDAKNNTVFNPHKNANKKNTLFINIYHKAPKHAEKYKIGIKQTKNDYNTIYSWRYYLDGQFAWVKLEGSNKHKVQEGDMLIIKNNSGSFESDIIPVKVLDIANQPYNFIPQNFAGTDTNNEINEQAGLYMKIRRSNTDINYSEDNFIRKSHYKSHKQSNDMRISLGPFSNKDENGKYQDLKIYSGAKVTFKIHNWRGAGLGGVGNGFYFEQTRYATQDYKNLEACWKEEFNASFGDFNGRTFWLRGIDNKNGSDDAVVTGNEEDGLILQVKSRVGASLTNRQKLEVVVIIENTSGTLIFETLPKHEDDSLFYETLGTYEIENGYHKGDQQDQDENNPAIIHSHHYNCYAYSNGVESWKIKDGFNEKALVFKFRPLITQPNGYKREYRNNDITYSTDCFNLESSYNGLSRFNSTLANWKSLPCEKGSIQRILSRNSDLLVFQEMQTVSVLFGKSVLYNAEGEPNIQQTNEVLGQKVFITNYGTQNPESVSKYIDNVFWVDKRNSAVLCMQGNSVYEIHTQGFSNEFYKIANRNSEFLGCVDPKTKEYLISIDDQKNVLSFQCELKGFTTYYTYNPEFFISSGKELFSWKQGVMYQHNTDENYNQFYGESYPSQLSFVINQEPLKDKIYKAIRIDSSTTWDIGLESTLNTTYIKKEELEKKESVFFAFIPNSANWDINNAFGIGEVLSVENKNITTKKDITDRLSLGDQLYNQDGQKIGEVVSIQGNTLQVDNINNIINKDTFLMGLKSSRIEGATIRGTYLKIDMIMNSDKKEFIYTVSTEVAESNLT